jgi:hypothetical protein
VLHFVGSKKKVVLDASGTDVMFFKIFSPKNSAKKLAFLLKIKLNNAKF